MKFNWGTGIVLFMVAFIGFILYMVIGTSGMNQDLYSEDYYKQEISFQQKIDAIQNAGDLAKTVRIEQEGNFVRIGFPETCPMGESGGNIYFYRPNNARLDRTFRLEMNGNEQYIPKSGLIPGLYNVNIEWEMNGETYLVEKELIIGNE